jgi:uncharacterized protein YdaU (DUF1376 family)
VSGVDTWMPLYIGDYLADTRRLTTTEHGAYLLMLMEQWRRGWLPDDDAQLARITGLRVEQWRRCAATLRCFFDAGPLPGTIRQKRLHAEREKAQATSAKRAESARTRWGGTTTGFSGTSGKHGEDANPLNGNESAHANALHMDKPGITQSQSQSYKREKEVLRTSPSPAPKRGPVADGFEDFWKHYPNKKGKRAAALAWPRAVQRAGSPAEIIDAVRLTEWDERENGRFIPHPTTWLNRDGWLDGIDLPQTVNGH